MKHIAAELVVRCAGKGYPQSAAFYIAMEPIEVPPMVACFWAAAQLCGNDRLDTTAGVTMVPASYIRFLRYLNCHLPALGLDRYPDRFNSSFGAVPKGEASNATLLYEVKFHPLARGTARLANLAVHRVVPLRKKHPYQPDRGWMRVIERLPVNAKHNELADAITQVCVLHALIP